MTGPCAKTVVTCTVVAPDGQRWIGQNVCRNPQPTCPRSDGEGYEKCLTICDQVGHAEVIAAQQVGAFVSGATAYLQGHTYFCEPCRQALEAVGVTQFVVGDPR